MGSMQTVQRTESFTPSSMLDGKSPRKDGSGSGGSVISQTPAAPARKDPNEEFFMMTFLSYKLNHREYERILAVRNPILY
jgi:hypothetical protein